MIIPGGFAQVTLKFTGAALPTGAVCTFGIENTEDKTAEEVSNAVAVALSDASVNTVMAEDVNLTAIHVKLGPTDTGPEFERAAAFEGTAGDAGYPGVCGLAKKTTALGGRSHKGRMFWPCLAETWVEPGGTIATSKLAIFGDFLGELFDNLASGDVPLVLLHGPDVADSPTTVISLTPATQVATQRRRNRR
jgi:hypothetical protein